MLQTCAHYVPSLNLGGVVGYLETVFSDFTPSTQMKIGRDRSAGIVNCFMLGLFGVRTTLGGGREIPCLSRLALGHTQTPVQ